MMARRPPARASALVASVLPKALLVVLVSAVSCGGAPPARAQIFYNGELDARMRSGLETYQKARDQHLGILRGRSAELDALEIDLRKAIVERSVAVRDADAAALLDLPRQSPVGVTLGAIIQSRLETLLGADAPLTLADIELRAIGGDDFEPIRKLAIHVDASEVEKLRGSITGLLGQRQISDGSAPPLEGWTPEWFCAMRETAHKSSTDPERFGVTVLMPRLSLGKRDALVLDQKLELPCASFAQMGVSPTGLGADATPALRFLLDPTASASDPSFPKWDRDVGPAQDVVRRTVATIREAELTASEQTRLDAAVSEVDANIAKLNEANTPVATAEIEAEAKTLSDLIQSVGRSGTAEDGAAATAAAPPQMSLGTALAFAEKLGLDGSALDKITESRFATFVGFLASPDERASKLTDCTSTDSQKRRAVLDYCVTDRLLAAIDAAEKLQLADRGVPGEIAAATVELAQAKLQSDVSKARGRSLALRLRNLDTQRRALLGEVALLYRAKRALADAKTLEDDGVARALFFWTQARNAGDLPYQLAVGSYPFIHLHELSDREQIVIASRYAVLDDLFATLSSYASGGLKPADAAAILSAVGVSAIGVKEVTK